MKKSLVHALMIGLVMATSAESALPDASAVCDRTPAPLCTTEWTYLRENANSLDRVVNRAEDGLDAERFERDHYLVDFLDYVHDVVTNHPESLSTTERDQLGQRLSHMARTLRAVRATTRQDSDEFAYRTLCEQAERITEDIMSPQSAIDSSLEPGLSILPSRPPAAGGGTGDIVRWANGAVGQSGTLYGFNVYNANTQYGGLACCAVVSAILIKANAIPSRSYEEYCPTMKNKLLGLGWMTYGNQAFRAGDVIFWKRDASDRERHIGIVVGKDRSGNWMTVDNDSVRKVVTIRPLFRPSSYPVAGPGARK